MPLNDFVCLWSCHTLPGQHNGSGHASILTLQRVLPESAYSVWKRQDNWLGGILVRSRIDASGARVRVPPGPLVCNNIEQVICTRVAQANLTFHHSGIGKWVAVSPVNARCWVPYRRHIKVLEAYHIRCLQSILNVRWWDKKTYTEICHLAKIDSAEHLLLQRQLRWLGHVICMPSNRLPRRLLYGELLSGQKPVGRPKLRYSDHIKSMLRKCNIPESNLENLAADRESWSSTCAAGLKNFSAASEQAASDRRARRHAASQATPAGLACPQCGRICASDFGLRSHLRSHHRPQNRHSSSTSWSKSTDYYKQASNSLLKK